MSDQKTEQPTQQRLKKAREEGQFAVSREFVSAAQFMVFVWLLTEFGASWFGTLRVTTRMLIATAYGPEITPAGVWKLTWVVARTMVSGPLLAGCALLSIALAAQLLSTRLGVSLTRLAPSLKRLNPISRIKELPRQNLPIFFQALILLPVFSAAVYALGKENWANFEKLPLASIESSVGQVAAALQKLLWRAAALFMVFGIVDLFRQTRRHSKDLRMTKQEIRDEFKQIEGNPLIKQRVRRIQRDLARRSMMKAIPTATAVIVNPTHYAVAIRYSLDSAGAPMVVAKGKNYLAQRIKAKALEHEVPIVENAPLAQALYKSVDIGQEIPAHLFRAVAEILAYIFKLMHGRLPGQS